MTPNASNFRFEFDLRPVLKGIKTVSEYTLPWLGVFDLRPVLKGIKTEQELSQAWIDVRSETRS